MRSIRGQPNDQNIWKITITARFSDEYADTRIRITEKNTD